MALDDSLENRASVPDYEEQMNSRGFSHSPTNVEGGPTRRTATYESSSLIRLQAMPVMSLSPQHSLQTISQLQQLRRQHYSAQGRNELNSENQYEHASKNEEGKIEGTILNELEANLPVHNLGIVNPNLREEGSAIMTLDEALWQDSD